MSMAPPIELNVTDLAQEGEVFEGPEKKLEVFFSSGSNPDGFRHFDQATWSDLLTEANCSILHHQPNLHFDAYLLSESSLFVYPSRVILKTCGTTSLLLALPKLLALAERLDVVVEHAHYGHLRYKFPEQQLYPHASFDQEREYLLRTFGSVEARVLGPADGRCWYALVAGQQLPTPPLPNSPREGDDLFEIVMEGLAPEVCQQFVGSSHPTLSGRALAQHMTVVSGIGALLPDVTIDDWAFEPCGYSMNGLRGAFYYTIHITPEVDFSYASFETNDPQYREVKWVQAVADVFQPSALTVTLTTRRVECELPNYVVGEFERNSFEVAQLGAGVSMCCINFSAEKDEDSEAIASRKRKLKLADASPIGSSAELSAELTASDSEGANSETEVSSDVSSVVGEQPEGPEAVIGEASVLLEAC